MQWNTINEIIQELRVNDGIPKESAQLVGDTVTDLMNGNDGYSNALQSVREWCGLTKPLLTAYIQQLNKAESSTAQKTLLLRILGNEIDKMNRVEKELNNITRHFKQAAWKFTILRNQLNDKSDAESKAIKRFAELSGIKLNRACTAIDEAKEELKEKIETIGNLKIQIERAESYVSTAELRNIAVQSAQKLIDDCNEYIKVTTI